MSRCRFHGDDSDACEMYSGLDCCEEEFIEQFTHRLFRVIDGYYADEADKLIDELKAYIAGLETRLYAGVGK